MCRLLAGDHDTARRLQRLAELTLGEAEALDEPRPPMQKPRTRWPKGTALGWMLRQDPHVRRLRSLYGLSLPDATGDTRDEVVSCPS